MRLAAPMLAALFVLTTTAPSSAQDASPEAPAASPSPTEAAPSTPDAVEATPADDPEAAEPAIPTTSPTPSPVATEAGDDAAPATTDGAATTTAHTDLRATVAADASAEGRLPLGPGSPTACPDDAVEIAFDAVPADAFVVGGYVEPLIEPTADAPDRATGIATCRDSSYAVAGFDAFLEQGNWDVYFVSPLADDAEHDHAADDAGADQDPDARHPDLQQPAADEDPDGVDFAAANGAVPNPPSWPAGMRRSADALSPSDPQDTCDPAAEPGALALKDLLTRTYGTDRYSISRSCNIGGRSEHKEGRAVDWMVDASTSRERQMGDEFTAWLLSTDSWGNRYAGMRRLGIMYMIWNRRSIYSWAVEDGWRTYTGSSPHDDHVHFSMSWPGARCDTSFWVATNCTGDVSARAGSADDGRADFDGDGRSDILWYGRGSAHDDLWYGARDPFNTSQDTRVNGTYEPLTGDFDGDGSSDILWYGRGSRPDSRWNGTSRKGSFDKAQPLSVKRFYEPFVGDFDGDGRDDVFWYAPGRARDSIWYGRANGWDVHQEFNAAGFYRPATGDFNGDGRDDIAWYAPGTASDHLWLGRRDRTFRSAPRPTMNMSATPITGDFDGDGHDDIFFYAPGSRRDRLWLGGSNADFSTTDRHQIAGTYRPFAGDFDGDGFSDIFWYGPNGTSDFVYYGKSSGFDPTSTTIGRDYDPVSGI